ncbi:hypothetical protein B296_00023344 [Ensete ventricosum]|uniref:Uncharacterized protein n=1 Tax=Ensete ventricosum TaxID=4639 RepID=A0A426YCE2_ENSVE|nr:hypothetical protein B296_00023344 [Ensete ventricosum]
MLHPSVRRDGVDEGRSSEAKENRIDVGPVIGWRRPCIRVAICLSIDQEKLFREHKGVEARVDRGEEATTSPKGLSYPKAKHQSEWRWTQRSAIVSRRQIY